MKRFTMHYANGAKVTVVAKECTVEKRNGAIYAVTFHSPKQWLSFSATDVVAVKQRRRFL